MARYNIEPNLLQDLLQLQTNTPIRYSQIDQYPKKLDLGSNIHNYITKGAPIQMQPTSMKLDFPENKKMDRQEFLERIYFTRLRNFGKAWISTDENKFTQ